MPLRLKIATGLLVVQVLVALGMLVLGFVMLTHKADGGFARGFEEALAVNAGAPSLEDYGPYHAGSHSFSAVLPIVTGGLALLGIAKRKYGLVMGVVLASGVLSLAQQGLPVLPAAVFVLACFGSAKIWLQGEANPVPIAPPPLPPLQS